MKEEVINSIESIDIASAMIEVLRNSNEDIKIIIFTNQLFGAEFAAKEIKDAVEWIKFRNDDSIINLAKIEFLNSDKQAVHFIRPKKEEI